MERKATEDTSGAARRPAYAGSHSGDRLLSCISEDGAASIRALDASELVMHATRLRLMSPTAATILGRTLMGAVLLSAGKPEGETLQIQLRGNGPIGSVTAIGDGEGRVRGTVSDPLAEAEGEGDHIDIGGAIGFGLLNVVRHHPSWREPVTGILPLERPEIALDLTRYLLNSEQIPSAVGLSVELDTEGHVRAAGGFLVQALPGAGDETLSRIEEVVGALPNAAAVVREGGAEALLRVLSEGVGRRAEHALTPVFFCPCSIERASRSVALLGREELTQMRDARESQEVVCEFCGEAYMLSPDDIGALIEYA